MINQVKNIKIMKHKLQNLWRKYLKIEKKYKIDKTKKNKDDKIT